MKFTYQEVFDYFKQSGCVLLSKEYNGSKSKLSYKCVCGNISEIEYRMFRQGKRCMKCGPSRAIRTNQINHGGNHFFQTNDFKEQRKKTFIEHFGEETPLRNKSVLKKRENTNLKKYGVKHVSQDPHIRERQKLGFKEKHGYDCPLQDPLIKEKYKNTMMKRYGVSNMGMLSTYCSKESQQLFWAIYNNLSDNLKEKTYFGELNHEYIASLGNECYRYDFVNSSILKCIEYNGSKFHPFSDMADNFTGWHIFLPNKTVKEARDYENKKFQLLRNRGYEILVVWDVELHKNLDELVRKCLDFLTNSSCD